MNRKLVLTLTGLLAAISIDAIACDYTKGEYADYFRCVVGEQNVVVVDFSTQSGAHIECIYELQDFRAPRLKAITLTQDGVSQDDTCGHIGSFCDSCKQNCDSTLREQQ